MNNSAKSATEPESVAHKAVSDNVGITCPNCGSKNSRVAQTHRLENGIMRLRKCTSCLKTFRTLER